MGENKIDFKLIDEEIVIEELKENWHCILHKEKIKWFRTAYKKSLWRNPILTNKRTLFLKNNQIYSEILLENILKAESKNLMKWGTPYIKLHLKNSNPNYIVFESIRTRITDTLLGISSEVFSAETLTKKWVKKINTQIEK